MVEALFTSALQKIISGGSGLPDVIGAADAMSRADRRDLAEQLYEVWIKFNPEHPQRYAIHFNLATLQTKTPDEDAAEKNLRAALSLNIDFMPAYVNLGGVLERKGLPEEAVTLWQQGVERLPQCTGDGVFHKSMILKQMARVQMAHQRQEAGEALITQVLELDPHQKDAIGQYIPLRQSHCKWPVIAPVGRLSRVDLTRAVQPLTMAAHTDDPMLQLAAAWRYVKAEIDELGGDPALDRRSAPIDLAGRRLRIGYVSSDLRDHAIGYLMAELFELHDRSKVEVFAYFCGGMSEGSLTPRIRVAVEHWVDIRALGDDEAARRIASDEIDILVDVNGLTKDARTAVFARRPAPVQVNWLGFPGSVASPYHHYIIADPWIIPPENEAFYTEKVVRLACYQSNDRKRVVAEGPCRAEAGLPEDAFVLCCFNGVQKITRFTFDRWIEILNAAPNTVLWLLDSNRQTEERLMAYAEARGVARSRFIFAKKLQNAHHLARYPLADLFLDTTPYGAHTTASDALWMGVPVLTLSGRSFASRVCGSLVRSAGLPELVCTTPGEYVARALSLINNPDEVKRLRGRLETLRGSCDLFNMDKLVADLEGLYVNMALDHQRGLTPQPDLRNLDVYHEIGVNEDHEAFEMQAVEDYAGFYRSRLARRHQARPIPPDARLWTPEAIAAAVPVVPRAASTEDAAPQPLDPVVHHPLLALQSYYDKASDLMCAPLLTKDAEMEVERLRALTFGITIEADPRSEIGLWDKHYRMLIDAIDTRLLSSCPTLPADEKDTVFLTSFGQSLAWSELQGAADRLGAEAVFFVAADEAYVDLYGRYYVQSVLKNCDVRAMIVLYVIGGAQRLAAVAASLGIRDERLVLAGDLFDISAVQTRSWDAPPKGLNPKPIANLQSVRFLKVGALMNAVKRPIFVSDIDLLLQRGVSDLLVEAKAFDLVLNQHTESTNAGSRLTANLVLLNPTATAGRFMSYLRNYLGEMLRRPEVTRWVDQFGLLMARHYIHKKARRANIGYFNTQTDINNVIYPSYQENPFRFLSLYHGFDVKSLEIQGEPIAPSVAAE